ncbi:hypothetical protein [Acetomicrobium sp.]|uniref:hypothetical protein n=1 Tax=Acetomicrobium sp. TaxID=1872099 RepID=UPI001BCEE967|nr:hypothetical protein [Acetomicrobium sp.]
MKAGSPLESVSSGNSAWRKALHSDIIILSVRVWLVVGAVEAALLLWAMSFSFHVSSSLKFLLDRQKLRRG